MALTHALHQYLCTAFLPDHLKWARARYQVIEQLFRVKVNYQSESIPIGSGSVESLVQQIDQRFKITGASWKPERVPQMLALRCAYINRKLDLYSLAS